MIGPYSQPVNFFSTFYGLRGCAGEALGLFVRHSRNPVNLTTMYADCFYEKGYISAFFRFVLWEGRSGRDWIWRLDLGLEPGDLTE